MYSEAVGLTPPRTTRELGSGGASQADMESRYEVDDENRAFIDGPGVLPTKGALDAPVGNGKGTRQAPVVVEEPVAPRRVSSRPKGFIKNR